MKTTLATVAGALTALDVFAQGQVYMFNNNPIDDPTGAPAGPASGGTYQAELVIDSGITGQTGPVPVAESICPVNAGYFNGPGSTGIFKLDGTQGTPIAFGLITYQVEAWDNAASYTAAETTPGDQFGISAVNTYILAGGTVTPSPPSALNFGTFQITTAIPEPTTLALGAMGLCAVLMFCRYPFPFPRRSKGRETGNEGMIHGAASNRPPRSDSHPGVLVCAERVSAGSEAGVSTKC